MNILFYIKSFISYSLKAKDEYSLHSPFMFDFFVNGVKAKWSVGFIDRVLSYFKSVGIEWVLVDRNSFCEREIESLDFSPSNKAIIFKGIHSNKDKEFLWKSLNNSEACRVCCDFFSYGIVFLTDKPLRKQSYILRRF